MGIVEKFYTVNKRVAQLWDEDKMMDMAEQNGFQQPMKKLDHETLRVSDPVNNDVAFLRFIERNLYVYSYKRSIIDI